MEVALGALNNLLTGNDDGLTGRRAQALEHGAVAAILRVVLLPVSHVALTPGVCAWLGAAAGEWHHDLSQVLLWSALNAVHGWKEGAWI